MNNIESGNIQMQTQQNDGLTKFVCKVEIDAEEFFDPMATNGKYNQQQQQQQRHAPNNDKCNGRQNQAALAIEMPTQVTDQELQQHENNNLLDDWLPLLTDNKFVSNQIFFLCPQCTSPFILFQVWLEHIKEHGMNNIATYNLLQMRKNEFKCRVCTKILTRCSSKKMLEHYISHLPVKIFHCRLCAANTNNIYTIISHIMEHKAQVDAIECENVTGDSSDAAEDENEQNILKSICRKNFDYLCPECAEHFTTEESWRQHINEIHNISLKFSESRYNDHFKCIKCDMEVFSSYDIDFQEHLFAHLPNKEYLMCHFCGWSSTNCHFLYQHMISLHRDTLEAYANGYTEETLENIAAANSITTTETAAPSTVQNTHVKNDDTSSSSFNDESDDIKLNDTISLLAAAATAATHSNANVDLMHDSVNTSRSRNKGFTCPGCKQLFATAAQRNAHNIDAHPKYKCRGCGKPFAIKNRWKEHKCNAGTQPWHNASALQIDTSMFMANCPKCSRVYNYEKCYKNHVSRCLKK